MMKGQRLSWAQRVPLPNTVRHHGAHIPKGTVVRTMRNQYLPPNSANWIEYVPAPLAHLLPPSPPAPKRVHVCTACGKPEPECFNMICLWRKYD